MSSLPTTLENALAGYRNLTPQQRSDAVEDIADATVEVLLTHVSTCKKSTKILFRELLDVASENQETIEGLWQLGQNTIKMTNSVNEGLSGDFINTLEQEMGENLSQRNAIGMFVDTITRLAVVEEPKSVQ